MDDSSWESHLLWLSNDNFDVVVDSLLKTLLSLAWVVVRGMQSIVKFLEENKWKWIEKKN